MITFSVAIVAGGKSSRMGTDKSFVLIHDRPLIQHQLDRVHALGQAETFIVTNHFERYAKLGLPMVSDVLPEMGSLGGIFTALTHAQHDWVFTLACDMPFINRELLQYMLACVDDRVDGVVPRVEGYPQGLHALYRKTCLPSIQQRLSASHLKVIGFYEDVTMRYLDEAEYAIFEQVEESFFNVNTPTELEQARQIYHTKFYTG
ncbi:MAG: molybdenum cofactor guanylyltransferase [Phototrophicaceae bacterium]